MPALPIRASRLSLLALILLTGCKGEGVPPDPSRFPLIPRPAQIQAQPGEFTFGPETTVFLASPPTLSSTGWWSVGQRRFGGSQAFP